MSFIIEAGEKIWYILPVKSEGKLSWDLFGKALVKECAQDFVTYFVPGARFVGMREGQLYTRADGPFEAREMRSDTVPEAEYRGKHALVNVEWQSTKDDKMDERLLGYSYELTRLHGIAVRSAVIYTQAVGHVPQSPLARIVPCHPLPEGNVALWFQFASLELSAKPAEELLALDLDAFAVLALLGKDGGTAAILEAVLGRLLLREEQRRETIAAAIFFAGKVFKKEADLKFLERMRTMLQDSLTESWMYQKVLAEGREKGIEKGIEEGMAKGLAKGMAKGLAKGMEEGLEKGMEKGMEEGLEKGLEKGRLEEARHNIKLFVEQRFPTELPWVRQQVERMSDLQRLQSILPALFRANTSEEVKQAFAHVSSFA